MLQEILIDDHERGAKKGNKDDDTPSPASVLHIENMSDTWSRASSRPTDESASTSEPGALPDSQAKCCLQRKRNCSLLHPV